MTDRIADQETQYGYRTPDGTEVWYDGHPPFPNYGSSVNTLDTQAGQDEAQDKFEATLRHAGLPVNWAKLEFIQRVKTTSFSETIPLTPRPSDRESADAIAARHHAENKRV